MGLPKQPTAVWSIWLDAEQNRGSPRKLGVWVALPSPTHPHSISPFPCSGATRPGTR